MSLSDLREVILCLGSPIICSRPEIAFLSFWGSGQQIHILNTSQLVGGEAKGPRGFRLDVNDLLRVDLVLAVVQLVVEFPCGDVLRFAWW